METAETIKELGVSLSCARGTTLFIEVDLYDADGEPYTLSSFPKMWKRCGTNDY